MRRTKPQIPHVGGLYMTDINGNEYLLAIEPESRTDGNRTEPLVLLTAETLRELKQKIRATYRLKAGDMKGIRYI